MAAPYLPSLHRTQLRNSACGFRCEHVLHAAVTRGDTATGARARSERGARARSERRARPRHAPASEARRPAPRGRLGGSGEQLWRRSASGCRPRGLVISAAGVAFPAANRTPPRPVPPYRPGRGLIDGGDKAYTRWPRAAAASRQRERRLLLIKWKKKLFTQFPLSFCSGCRCFRMLATPNAERTNRSAELR